ncbi:hypothetical protein KI387_015561 [Taxus chinensis]|uniref:Uncharacterized protein n=1 Tax=Taxus chinensis TaxID=29808 RepID=A0AA38GCC9_TAXCH|nr:hypothetical protein KI387_015561 [Taxus chinensis]
MAAMSEQERIQVWKKAARSRLVKMFNQLQQTLAKRLSRAASFDPKKWELHSVVEAAFSAQLPYTQIKALVLLAGWLTSQQEEEEDVTDAIIRMGIVPRLLHFMKLEGGSSTDVHYWAAWVLESIALKHPQRLLAHNGILPRLLHLFSSKSEPVQQQALWTIGTLSSHSAQCRDAMLLAHGAAMVNYFPQFSTRTISVALSTISTLFIFSPIPPLEHLIPLLAPLQNLLDPDNDIQILSKSCYIIRRFCDRKGEGAGAVQAVIDAGICDRLVQLLFRHPAPYVGTAIAAIASKSIAATALLLTIISTKHKRDDNWKAFLTETCRIIYYILLSRKPECLTRTCQIISKITEGNTEDIQTVIDGKIIHQLLDMVEEAELPVKKEIATVIANVLVHGSEEQMKYLIEEGWMKPLTNLFAHSDTALATLCFQSMNIIREFLNWI